MLKKTRLVLPLGTAAPYTLNVCLCLPVTENVLFFIFGCRGNEGLICFHSFKEPEQINPPQPVEECSWGDRQTRQTSLCFLLFFSFLSFFCFLFLSLFSAFFFPCRFQDSQRRPQVRPKLAEMRGSGPMYVKICTWLVFHRKIYVLGVKRSVRTEAAFCT